MEKNLTEAELKFCHYQLNLLGGFMTSLFEAMIRADVPNSEKLKKVYPEYMEVIWKYKNESGYWDDLLDRWNVLNPERTMI